MTRDLAQRGFRVGAVLALATGVLSVVVPPASPQGILSLGTFIFALVFLAAMVVVARRGSHS